MILYDLDELVIVSAPQRSGRSPLSPAELEVAKLVASGRTNQEIAKARRTSARTVANQVASAMKKLGASSRVALAGRLAGRG